MIDRETLEELPARMSAVEQQIGELRVEMRALNEETRLATHALHYEAMAQTRMLHEEVLGRIATISEGRRRPRKP